MKYTIPSLAVSLLLIPMAIGQAPAEPSAEKSEAPRRERPDRAAMLQKQLELTDAQSEQMTAVMSASREKMQAVRTDASLTEEQKAEATEKLRTETQTKVAAILTPEQMKKWEEMRERGRSQRGERGQRGERSRGQGEREGRGAKPAESAPEAP